MNGALRFADAWLLWGLTPLFLAIVALWWYGRRTAHSALAPTATALGYSRGVWIATLPHSWRQRLRPWVEALRLASLALLVLAMARPQATRRDGGQQSEGIDIMMVLDTSGSMRALDMEPELPVQERRTRLAVVKDVVREFVDARPADEVGLVVFGEQAFTQVPLTLDHDALHALLEQIDIGMAGESTAIGTALGIGGRRLQSAPARSRVVVLLTDGRNNSGTLAPEAATEIATTLGMRVYTIGVGGRGKAPFLVDSLFGKRVVYEDVQIDEAALQQIAARTGGAYYRAEDAGALKRIYEAIDGLERSKLRLREAFTAEELFPSLVTPALILLLVETLLLATLLRKVP